MVQISIKSLQEAARVVQESQTPEEELFAISRIIDLFAKETAKLEFAYARAKKKYREVSTVLEETTHQLENKIGELRITTAYLNRILEHTKEGVIFIGNDGLVTTFNKQAEKILEMDRINVLFRDYREVFTPHLFGFSIEEVFRTEQAPSFKKVAIESKQLIVETTLITHEEKYQLHYPSPLSDFTSGILISIRDITQLQKLEMQNRQNDRMKELGELISIISHEVRNPLGGIMGLASLLEDQLDEAPEKKQLVSTIIKGIENLHQILDGIVNYSRPSEIILADTEMGSMIEEVLTIAKADKTFNPHIKVNKILPSIPIIIPISRHLMQSALHNIITNAFHAMPEGGTLDVSLKDSETEAVITISDSGCGIPQVNMEKIFQPFFTTKPKGKGTGFGLAEAARTVRAHSGQIFVESTVGKGTTFIIKLLKIAR